MYTSGSTGLPKGMGCGETNQLPSDVPSECELLKMNSNPLKLKSWTFMCFITGVLITHENLMAAMSGQCQRVPGLG